MHQARGTTPRNCLQGGRRRASEEHPQAPPAGLLSIRAAADRFGFGYVAETEQGRLPIRHASGAYPHHTRYAPRLRVGVGGWLQTIAPMEPTSRGRGKRFWHGWVRSAGGREITGLKIAAEGRRRGESRFRPPNQRRHPFHSSTGRFSDRQGHAGELVLRRTAASGLDPRSRPGPMTRNFTRCCSGPVLHQAA